jgi:hypothetical protein
MIFFGAKGPVESLTLLAKAVKYFISSLSQIHWNSGAFCLSETDSFHQSCYYPSFLKKIDRNFDALTQNYLIYLMENNYKISFSLNLAYGHIFIVVLINQYLKTVSNC